MSTQSLHIPVRLRLSDKALLTLALGIAVALFLTIGSAVLAPRDPQGAISLLTHPHPILMLLECAALAAVAATIATVLAGSRLVDVGIFAAGLGMGLAVIQGDTSAYILRLWSAGGASAGKSPAMLMLVESLLWSAVFALVMVVSGWVMAFCKRGPVTDDSRFSVMDMAVSECAGLNRLVGIDQRAVGTRHGITMATMIAVTATLLFSILASGSSPRIVQHGQICFAVFVAFYGGVWLAKKFGFTAQTPLPVLGAVPIAAILAYLWATLQPGSGSTHVHIPSSVYLRALPLTFVSVGMLGSLVGYWIIPDQPPRKSKSNAGSKKRKK